MKVRKRRKRRGRERNAQLSHCAFCEEWIPEDAEVFYVGGKARPEFDLTPQEGRIILVPLNVSRRIIPCTVATRDSAAKAEGYDLAFMVCSEECAESLRAAMKDELELYQRGPGLEDGEGE